MSEEPLDQRPYQPSEAYLDRLREKGDVPVSQEFQAAIRAVASGLAGYVLLSYAWQNMRDGLAFPLQSVPPDGTAAEVGAALHMSGVSLWPVSLFALVTVFAIIAAAIFDRGGLMVRTEGLVPSLKQLNPIASIKEWFTLDAGYRFLLGTLKLAIYASMVSLLLRSWASTILWSPACGPGCGAFLLARVIMTLYLAHIVIAIMIGLMDRKISRLLFHRRHRMSLKQIRQEHRDNYGSPEVKSAIRHFNSDDGMPSAPNLYLKGERSVYALAVTDALDGPIFFMGTAVEPDASRSGLIISAGGLEAELSGLESGTQLPPALAARIRLAVFRLGE